MNNILLGTRDSLDCNMESLISDLRHQYTAAAAAAAAATTAVSQAMLMQAINNHQTRLEALTPPGQIVQSREQPASQVKRQAQIQPPPASRQIEQSTTNAQFVPLDLSVRTRQVATSQNSRSRGPKCSSQRRQHLPYDLVKTRVQAVGQEKIINNENPDVNNNNNNHRPQQAHTKLISSSTSPSSILSGEDENERTISASSTRVISSSSPNRLEHDDHHHHHHHEFSIAMSSGGLTKGLTMAATDVISSTNGRRQGRQTGGKKQKTSRCHLCNHCGRSFARSDMLTRHSRVHSGLKPFQCGECFQEFSRSDHLSTHQRTHTGEKPYQCDSCGYSACRRDMITRHMRTHLGQRVKRSRGPRSRKTSQSATPTSSTASTIGNRVTRKRRSTSSRYYEGTDGKVDDHGERDNVFASH